MIPLLRTARLIVVFGDGAYTIAHRIHAVAAGGGVRCAIFGDNMWLEGWRYAALIKKLAHQMATPAILALEMAAPHRVKAATSLGDLSVACTGSDGVFLIPPDGYGFSIVLPPGSPRVASFDNRPRERLL